MLLLLLGWGGVGWASSTLVLRHARHAQTLHHDCWADPWKRSWVNGAIFFLHPTTWQPTWLLACFAGTAVWTGPDVGGEHSTAAIATALSNALVTQGAGLLC